MKENIKKGVKIMKFIYNKNDFFGKDGWILFDDFKVAVGEKGELEYMKFSNSSYYEQNPYYTIIKINRMENDIQNDTNRFEDLIREKIKRG